MARVMQDSGEQAIEDSVGVDATGQVFNSIVAVEQYKGHEMNPLVNPGAIATTGMVSGKTDAEKWYKILATHSDFAGRQARGEPGGLQVRGRDQPAQPGDRRADVRLRPDQGRPEAW